MAQTKSRSFQEAVINILVGCTVAMSAQMVLFPLHGIHIPITTDFSLMLCFTVVSLVRQYVIRRWFNKGD